MLVFISNSDFVSSRTVIAVYKSGLVKCEA